MSTRDAKVLRIAPLETPTDLKPDAVAEISGALRILLADMFALYVKTKNYHWHMSGPHFRDYHLLLDEQSEQIFATTDDIAERARKIGGTRFVQSDISVVCSGSRTTTPILSLRWICSPSCVTTTNN
jgi:starvation-inducible DNA-binding protein